MEEYHALFVLLLFKVDRAHHNIEIQILLQSLKNQILPKISHGCNGGSKLIYHTCHKLWTEICEIRQIFKGDWIKFCERFTKISFKLPNNRLWTMANLAIIVRFSYSSHSSNQNVCEKWFSADLLQKLPSHILPGSPVYCKPLGQQNKRNDSFPQSPGFCADGVFMLLMYFGADNIHLTDKISLHRIYWLLVIGWWYQLFSSE